MRGVGFSLCTILLCNYRLNQTVVFCIPGYPCDLLWSIIERVSCESRRLRSQHVYMQHIVSLLPGDTVIARIDAIDLLSLVHDQTLSPYVSLAWKVAVFMWSVIGRFVIRLSTGPG